MNELEGPLCTCEKPDFGPLGATNTWPICKRCGGTDRELLNPIQTKEMPC